MNAPVPLRKNEIGDLSLRLHEVDPHLRELALQKGVALTLSSTSHRGEELIYGIRLKTSQGVVTYIRLDSHGIHLGNSYVDLPPEYIAVLPPEKGMTSTPEVVRSIISKYLASDSY